MKKIIVGLVLLFPLVSLADFSVDKWVYYKDISGGDGEVRKIVLDDEILSGAKKDLSDLRVVDAASKEIPFKVMTGKSENVTSYNLAKVINNSVVPNQFSTAIVDIGERGQVTNSLEINTLSENFQRNVKIYGSDDMVSWNVLKDNGYIYDYTDKKGNFKSQNTRIDFPDAVFRYIKVEIADENNNPVKISAVSVRQNIQKSAKTSQRPLSYVLAENSDKKISEIVGDLGLEGIPINKLVFQVSDNNFNRGLVIYSSSDKEKWKFLSQGYIFRYNTSKFSGENLEVSLPETNDRYLKIEVLNNDNAPLSFSKIDALSVIREIAFPVDKNNPGNNYRIYYGNPKATYSRYDLEKYFQYLDVSGADYSNLSSQKNNSSYVVEKEPEKPFTERMPYFLPIVLVSVVLVLMLLVYRFLKE